MLPISTTKPQPTFDLIHELVRAAAQFDHDRAFRRSRFFQIGELTLQQCRIHEVTAPVALLVGNQLVASPKIYEPHVGADVKAVAISFL